MLRQIDLLRARQGQQTLQGPLKPSSVSSGDRLPSPCPARPAVPYRHLADRRLAGVSPPRPAVAPIRDAGVHAGVGSVGRTRHEHKPQRRPAGAELGDRRMRRLAVR